MDEKYIAQLEEQLESLIEGTFTSLFRKRVTAHDIAMKLSRSLEGTLRYIQDGDNRPVAPDAYTIHLHPKVEQKLRHHQSQLDVSLAQYIVDLVAQSGYRLNAEPVVQIISDTDIEMTDVEVEARHTVDGQHTTQSMQPIRQADVPKMENPQLIINDGERTIELKQSLLNIGRADDNHIVLDDKYCSRHHIQLRLRFGAYILFDVNSRSGTTVNDIPVTEHVLQSGDVIQIGRMQLVFVAGSDRTNTTGTTQSLDPVTF